MDQRRVASQVLHFLVGDNETADSLGEVDEERRVANVILRDLSLVVSELGEVGGTVGTEDGEADDGVTDHDGTVLYQHRVVDAHQEALLQHEADVLVQLFEALVNVGLLPFVAIVESNFLGVGEDFAVEGAVLALEALLLGSQSAEGRRDHLDDEARERVPRESQRRSFPADKLGELSREENCVEGGLDEVDVKSGKAGSPLLSILSEALVGIGDPVVEIADLVVVHVAEVLIVEVTRKSLPEEQRQLLLNVVDARVDHGGGHSEQE